MGLFDFFKKKSEVNVETLTINFGDLSEKVAEKLKNDEMKISEVRNSIDLMIKEFVSKLNDEKFILSNVDLSNKKEAERVKNIVLLGRDDYLLQLERLISDFEKLDEDNLNEYFKVIDQAINYFYNNSRKKFAKTNYLIGKEINNIERTIKEFHQRLNNYSKECANTLFIVGEAENFRKLFDAYSYEKELIEKVENDIMLIEKDHERLLLECDVRNKEVELFKEGEEYKSWLKDCEEFKARGKKFDFELMKFKEKFDFKEMMNEFHSISKAKDLIQRYRDNFFDAFSNDKKFHILEYVDGRRKKGFEKDFQNLIEEKKYLDHKISDFEKNKKSYLLEQKVYEVENKLEGYKKEIILEKVKMDKFNEKAKTFKLSAIDAAKKILGNVSIE